MLRGKVVNANERVYELPVRHATSEVRFELDGVCVLWRGESMLAAKDGEDLIVSGYFKGAEYWVLAWWNVSRGFGGNQGKWGFWLGFVLSAAGLALLGFEVGTGRFGANESVVGGLLIVVAGLMMMRSGFVVGEAVKAVRRVRLRSA